MGSQELDTTEQLNWTDTASLCDQNFPEVFAEDVDDLVTIT